MVWRVFILELVGTKIFKLHFASLKVYSICGEDDRITVRSYMKGHAPLNKYTYFVSIASNPGFI